MFDPTKQMFPAAEQLDVIRNSTDFVELMRSAPNVYEWNLRRDVIKASIKRTNFMHYAMLMGFVDGVVFPQTLKSWRN